MATLKGVNRVLRIKVFKRDYYETFYKWVEDDNYYNKIMSKQ